MTTLAIYYITDWIISSTMVGIVAFSIKGERLIKTNMWINIFAFVVLFASWDMWNIFMFSDFDIYFKIGNKDIINFFNLGDNLISLNDLMKVGGFDIGQWIIQGALSYFIGFYFYGAITKRNITSRST